MRRFAIALVLSCLFCIGCSDSPTQNVDGFILANGGEGVVKGVYVAGHYVWVVVEVINTHERRTCVMHVSVQSEPPQWTPVPNDTVYMQACGKSYKVIGIKNP